ncbi:hypothetical protein HK102_010756 [Quaeritorhiza haematococci]|nr:hypothetical protein HK102_010756 [Quaeritorhiza haematococci]
MLCKGVRRVELNQQTASKSFLADVGNSSSSGSASGPRLPDAAKAQEKIKLSRTSADLTGQIKPTLLEEVPSLQPPPAKPQTTSREPTPGIAGSAIVDLEVKDATNPSTAASRTNHLANGTASGPSQSTNIHQISVSIPASATAFSTASAGVRPTTQVHVAPPIRRTQRPPPRRPDFLFSSGGLVGLSGDAVSAIDMAQRRRVPVDEDPQGSSVRTVRFASRYDALEPMGGSSAGTSNGASGGTGSGYTTAPSRFVEANATSTAASSQHISLPSINHEHDRRDMTQFLNHLDRSPTRNLKDAAINYSFSPMRVPENQQQHSPTPLQFPSPPYWTLIPDSSVHPGHLDPHPQQVFSAQNMEQNSIQQRDPADDEITAIETRLRYFDIQRAEHRNNKMLLDRLTKELNIRLLYPTAGQRGGVDGFGAVGSVTGSGAAPPVAAGGWMGGGGMCGVVQEDDRGEGQGGKGIDTAIDISELAERTEELRRRCVEFEEGEEERKVEIQRLAARVQELLVAQTRS